MQTTRDQLNEIIDAAEIDEDAVRPHYPARGLFGSTCLAIVGDENFAYFLMAAAEILIHDEDVDGGIRRTLANFTLDSMGTDVIYYWTSITVA